MTPTEQAALNRAAFHSTPAGRKLRERSRLLDLEEAAIADTEAGDQKHRERFAGANPSPEEIAAMTAEFRKGWTEATLAQRDMMPAVPWDVENAVDDCSIGEMRNFRTEAI